MRVYLERLLFPLVLLILLPVMLMAAGIRDEIFYLDTDHNLNIVADHLAALKADSVPELINILQEGFNGKTLKTIAGKYKMSGIAQGTIILKISEFNDHRAKDIVEKYLEKADDRFAREAAAVSLGSVGDASSIPGLKNALVDRDPVLQLYSARALGELGDTSGYETAKKYLASEIKTLKTQAMYALAMIGKKEATPLLEPELKNPDFRDPALLAIKIIAYHGITAEAKPDFLKKILKENSGEVGYWAANEYLMLGDKYISELKTIAADKTYKSAAAAGELLREKGLVAAAGK
jgi:HEAT repeat protein